MVPNFTREELQCKGSGKLILAPGFAQALQGLRDVFGKPMKVNSCCRSREHNKAVDGHPRSLHVCDRPYHATGGTCAIDIGITMVDKELREELAELAWERGWSVGFNPRFLHLDLRTEYAGLKQVRFSY